MKYFIGIFFLFLDCTVNAQNVGIGTKTPQVKLHVVDSVNSVETVVQTMNTNSNVNLRLINGGSGFSFEKRNFGEGFANNIQSTSGDINFGTSSANPIKFSTNNVEAMRILANGKIGIGTQTPKSPLEINSDSVFTVSVRSQNYSPSVAFKLADSVVGYIYADKNYGRGLTLISGKGIQNPGDVIPPISINPGNNYGAIFFPNGRTVIAGNYTTYLGSDTAATLNVVNQSTLTNPQLNLQDDASGNFSRLQFSNTGISKYWHLAGLSMNDSTQARLNFYYKGIGNIMSIAGDGKVGIGTTNPQTALHIHSSINNEAMRLQANNFPSLTFYNGNNLHSQIKTNGSYLDFNTTSNYGFSFSNGVNNNMVIDQYGNVGIGTSAPNNKLEVIGTVRIADGTQGANRVLTSDATGNTSWVDPVNPLALTKTDTMYISGLNFKSLNPQAQVFYDEAGSAYLTPSTTPLSDKLFAPIVLPEGAVMQSVKFRYIDNSNTQRIYIDLNRTSLLANQNVATPVGIWTFSLANQVPFQSNAPQYMNASLVGSSLLNIISNNQYHYYITVYTGNGGSLAWDSNIQIRGVEIVYTRKL